MAEGFLRHMLKERGLRLEVSSAGLCTVDGLSASLLAIEAMRERGIDISLHRSRQVDERIIQGASHVVGVTARHREALLAQFPEMSTRITTFPLPDIPDPYGRDIDTYRGIRNLLAGWSLSLLSLLLKGLPKEG